MTIQGSDVSRGRTLLGVVVCIALVLPAMAVAFFPLNSLFGIGDPRDSWLPARLPYLIKVVFHIWLPIVILYAAAGWISLSLAVLIVRRANRMLIAYVAAAVYGTLFVVNGVLSWNHFPWQPVEWRIGFVPQVFGLVLGLVIAAQERGKLPLRRHR